MMPSMISHCCAVTTMDSGVMKKKKKHTIPVYSIQLFSTTTFLDMSYIMLTYIIAFIKNQLANGFKEIVL